MAARTVAVRLQAEVSGYITGMNNAAKATKSLGQDVAAEAKKNKAAWAEVGQGMLAFGALVGAGVGLAVKKFADFDAAMSSVQAATHESAAGMKTLRDAALEAGARTAFSATEAAEAIEQLAKAGVSTADILGGGLNGALDLAAAGTMEVGDAAEIAATAMTQFRLEGSQVPHIADLLAAAAGKAQGDVTDMAAALKQSGLVAAQMGLSIEETTGTLGAFASAGLLGSDAGTSFRTMLLRLTNPTKESAELMRELGLTVYDAQGEFVGMEGLAGQLTARMGELDPATRNAALATIFGSDAIRAANVLYQQGAQGIADWTAKVDDQGYAAETAAIKLDNLKGDLEALGGSIETALIKSGTSANGVLREMVQAATSAVNAYGALPGPVQATATGVAAVAAAAALAGGAFLIAVPKVVAFRAAIGDMGPTSQRFARGLGGIMGVLAGPWGIALGAGVTALGFWAAGQAEAKARVDEHAAALDQQTGAIGQNSIALAVKRLEERGLLEDAQKLGISIDLVTRAALGEKDAIDALSGVVDGYSEAATEASRRAVEKGVALDEGTQSAFDNADAAEKLMGVVEDESKAVGEAREKWDRTSAAMNAAKGATGQLEGATAGATEAVVDNVQALKDQMAAIRDATNLILGLRDASRGYEAAVDDASAALRENGRTLDINTEKGRANEAALDAIATSAGEVLQQMVESGAPIADVTAKLGLQRTALIKAAEGFGMTEEQAWAYAEQVLKVPTNVTTTAKANTETAAAKVDNLSAKLDRIDGRVVTASATVFVNGINSLEGAIDKLNRLDRRAGGGWVEGPGTGTSDSVLLRASAGEYVVNARAAHENAALLEAINAGRAPQFITTGASGGSAAPSVNVAAPNLGPLLAEVRQMRQEQAGLREEFRRQTDRQQAAARKTATSRG